MRLPTGRRSLADPLAAVAIATVALLGLADDATAARPTDAAAVALVLAATLPIAVERRAPLAVLGLISAALLAALALGYGAGGAVLAVGWMFGRVAAAYPTRVALGAAAASAVAVIAGPLAARGQLDAGEVAGGLVLLSLPWLVGDRIRARREAAATAAREERARIARDLHDTVAHALSVVAVQADAGAALIDDDRERARAALAAIRATAREALADVREVVGELREREGPGLDALPELVRAAGAGGLAIDLVDERPAAVAPRVDAAAYRIVQEALTNVRRHAAASRAVVRVAADGGQLVVAVSDDGVGAPATEGNGIAGMRERARRCGGQLEAGALAGGGFQVVARLPLGNGA